MTSPKPLFLATLILAAGCATTSNAPAGSAPGVAAAVDTGAGTPAAPAVAGKPNEDVVCYFERPTGSNIREKVCRSRTQRERERANAQQVLQGVREVNTRVGN
jgi:hypothetical protein